MGQADDTRLDEGQKLTETWTVEFEGRRPGAPMVARLNWPHHTIYLARGEGVTLQEARLNLVSMLARAIHEDPNPFGDLGNVAHISQVVKLLEALKEGPTDEKPESDYFLPNQLSPEKFAELPQGWQTVIGHVIDMLCSWADYYPEEDAVPEDPGPIEKGGPGVDA